MNNIHQKQETWALEVITRIVWLSLWIRNGLPKKYFFRFVMVKIRANAANSTVVYFLSAALSVLLTYRLECKTP